MLQQNKDGGWEEKAKLVSSGPKIWVSVHSIASVGIQWLSEIRIKQRQQPEAS